jgi:hypothetical protein
MEIITVRNIDICNLFTLIGGLIERLMQLIAIIIEMSNIAISFQQKLFHFFWFWHELISVKSSLQPFQVKSSIHSPVLSSDSHIFNSIRLLFFHRENNLVISRRLTVVLYCWPSILLSTCWYDWFCIFDSSIHVPNCKI